MFDHPLAETVVPEPWMKGDDISVTNQVARVLKQMIVIKILRPDRLLAAANKFLAQALGNEIVNINPVDLLEFAGAKISPKNPIMLVSAPGFDAS
jgi:dynein heavy chain 1, cytosolic